MHCTLLPANKSDSDHLCQSELISVQLKYVRKLRPGIVLSNAGSNVHTWSSNLLTEKN